MSADQIKCPKCSYDYPYEEGGHWICPDCNHQWNPSEKVEEVVADAVS